MPPGSTPMRRAAAVAIVLAVVLVLLPAPAAQIVALVLAVGAALILDPPVLGLALGLGVLLALALAAAITGALVAWSEGVSRGLAIGGVLLLRLSVLTIATGVMARSCDADAVLGFARRLRIRPLGLVLGLALNTLPRLAEAASQVWTAQRVRSPSRWRLVRAMPRLAEVLLAHTGRIAEEAAAAASLRGHAALTRVGAEVRPRTRVVVVTGRPDCGKTTAILAAVGELIRGGTQVAGFAQPGVWDEGSKVGFLVRDLGTGEEAELARRVERDQGQHGTCFRFSEAGFSLASQALARTAPGAVLVVDEVGPVELRGHGHMPALRAALRTEGLTGAILVVRRHLVPALLAALAAEDAILVDVLSEQDTTAAIVRALG